MSEENDTWLKTIPLLNSETGRNIAREICEKHGFSHNVFMELVKAEVEDARMKRRRILFENFDDIFGTGNRDVD